MKRFAVLFLGMLLACAGAGAQAASAAGSADGSGSTGSAGAGGEDEFFGSSDVEAKQGAAETQKPAEAIEKERLGFSGQLQAQSTYTMTRDFVLRGASPSVNSFANAIIGDFFVDARLPKSFRMFMDVNVNYVPTGVPVPVMLTIPPSPAPVQALQSQTTVLNIKEVFVDFNAANTVYFRAGKQVLKWGVGYFWNPTDLINVERRSITNLDALLEGTFGLRTDVTFSSAFHLYTFVNLNEVQNDLSAISYSARSEFLVGTVEFGLAAWYRYNQVPVFGADLTMPLFWSLNLTAEASMSWGDPSQKLDPLTGPYSVSDQLVPKVDIGLSRTFDAFDIKDRITVMAEFFWNSDGYDQNMFSMPGFAASGYYHAGYYGQYYGALFVTINSFGLSNMTLSLNGLMNFSDSSAVAIVGLSYAPISNFTLLLQLGSYLGADNREYTVSFNPTTGAPVNNMFFVNLGATVTF